jgi:site-specific recombinase XerD
MPSHAIAPSPVSVGDLTALAPADLAVAGFLARYRGRTLQQYRDDLKLYLSWCLGLQLPLLTATRPHLELYQRWLEVQTSQAGTRWAESTISRRFGTVATMYHYAHLDGLIPADPAVHVTRPVVHLAAQRRLFYTPLEYALVLEAARRGRPGDHALIALLGMRALRIGETCALDVEDLTTLRGYTAVTLTRKGGIVVTLPLPMPVTRAVLEHLEGRTTGPLLLNCRGHRLDRNSASRAIARCAEAAKIVTPISPHGLRRTCLTTMFTLGIPLRDIQLAAGHASPKTTVIYDMASTNPDRDATHRLASYMAGISAGG